MVRERDVEKRFVREVKRRGGEVRKVKWLGRTRAPDRLALLGGRHFLAELKRPGKTACDGQAREHKRLRQAGFKVYVLDTYMKIELLFCYYDQGVLPDAL